VTTGQAHAAVGIPDPRPALEPSDGEWLVAGARCTSCGYAMPDPLERCPVCRGACEPARFGPEATVFAGTVLRVPVPGRTPPFALAYVDIDDGPRVLVHVDRTDAALAPGTRVRLAGVTADGDPLVTPADSAKAVP
jgi:uncharacterized OB-fold protein